MKWSGPWPKERPPLEVLKGERLLSWARAELPAQGGGEEAGDEVRTREVVIGGTRDAFYLPDRVPWEQIKAADWDQETGLLRVSELGEWGQRRAIYEFTVSEPGLLLQLVRERITASVVLQRHVAIVGKRGVRVVARRPPGKSLQITWFFEFDQGIDPAEPAVAQAADEALRTAQADISTS